MGKSFLSYVFRPHRVVLAALALAGILFSKNSSVFLAAFAVCVLNFAARTFSYFVDQRLTDSWKKGIDKLAQEPVAEQQSNSNIRDG